MRTWVGALSLKWGWIAECQVPWELRGLAPPMFDIASPTTTVTSFITGQPLQYKNMPALTNIL